MADVAFLIGALIPTGVLAALFIWMPGRYVTSIVLRAGIANALALVGAALIGGMGMADGGPPKFDAALVAYALPQAIWLPERPSPSSFSIFHLGVRTQRFW